MYSVAHQKEFLIQKISLSFSLFIPVMLASVPFITATIFVYMCVPELRNMHGIVLTCYLATLAVAYTTLASVQLYGLFEQRIEQPGCKIIAHIIYFAFLSTFFWTNVLSFDLWWGFRYVETLMKLSTACKYNSNCSILLFFIHPFLLFAELQATPSKEVDDGLSLS